VHQSQVHPAGLFIPPLEPDFDEFKQRQVRSPIRLNKEAGWLIKGQKVVVFIEDRPLGHEKIWGDIEVQGSRFKAGYPNLLE